MKRVIVRRPGGHAALELIDETDPKPGPGEVLVRARACGVNFADVAVRLGLYEAAKGLYPITPGFEFAGVVEALGPGARTFKVGDKVFGVRRFGGYAEAHAISESQLWPCPEGWSFSQSAGLAGVHLTAYHGLFNVAKVAAGETVLVHSAAGGAGSAFVLQAKAAGCRVVGVVGSSGKAALCRELGCDAVIDRFSQDLWAEAERAAPGGFDAIFDANGVATLREGFKRLAPGGRLVVYGFAEFLSRGAERPSWPRMAWSWLRMPRFSPLDMTMSNRGVLGFNLAFLFHKLELARGGMERVLSWAREGKVRPVPTAEFPLSRAADAHRAIESGKTTGKLVLTV